MNLEEEHAASKLRYDTARRIGKILADLPKEDVPKVMLHVGIEWGLIVTEAKTAPAVAGKVG